MELFLTKLFGIYFLVIGIIVVLRQRSLMPAVRDLLKNRSMLLVLGALELVAGLALLLIYPSVSFSIPGLISLFGWMMTLEGIIYLALPLSSVQKLVGRFNKPSMYFWGGLASLLLGFYMTGVGFGFVTEAHAQTAPSITTFALSPSSIFNGYSASLSYSILNGGGADIMFTCPTGVTLTYNGVSYPCGSRQSLSRASDSMGFTFINVSGVPRTVSVRLYPKDTSGTSYDSVSEEKSITIEPAFITVQSLTASATTISSEQTVTFTWEGIYAPGTNMRFDCGPYMRVEDENGTRLPCAQPAFSSDMSISGSKTLKFINESASSDSSVSVNVLPSIVAGSYDGSRGKSIGITVKPKAAAPDPAATSFTATPTTVASGGLVYFSFSAKNTATTSLQFSCANVTVANASTTAICNTPTFSLGASATSFPVTFTNRGYSKETVRVMLLLGKENGSYLLAQSTDITVLPIGQAAPAATTPSVAAAPIVNPAGNTLPATAAVPHKFSATLWRGIKHADVMTLQKFLAQDPTIYPEGLATGFFGAATEAALKRFQKKYGITQTGTVGPMTRAKLNSLLKP